jgi:hypothetical protein
MAPVVAGGPSDALLIRHLGSGKYSDVFSVRAGSRRLAMKISYYRDGTLSDVARRALRGDLDGATAARQRDAVCVASAFARFTAGISRTVSPHFVAVHVSRDCDGLAERLRPLLAGRLRTLTEAQRRHNNVSFMERFDANVTRYLLRGDLSDGVLCGLIFQIVYTLAALQKLLPGFRHNDLSTNNVLLRYVPQQTVVYQFETSQFAVSLPILVALSDYDFTHVPGHRALSNERILGGKYPHMSAADNPSYDTHLFLKSVHRCLARRGDRHAPRTRAFLASLALRDQDRLAEPMPRLAPAALLRHAYFDTLRRPPRSHSARYAC